MSTFVDFELSSKCIDLGKFLSVSSELIQEECIWQPESSVRMQIPSYVKEDCNRSNLISEPVQELMQILDDQSVSATREARLSSRNMTDEGESRSSSVEGSEVTPVKLDERRSQLLNQSALHTLNPSFQKQQVDPKRRIPLNILSNQMNSESLLFEEFEFRRDLVVSVSFFHPRRKVILSELEVLGTQTLHDLIKSFKCASDQYHIFSNDRSVSVASKDCVPSSSFFFMEGVFYNDVEQGKSDYTKPILNWLRENDRHLQPGLGDYTTKSASDQRWVDLSLRLNYPYVFCHQGNCEHMFVISQVRLWNPSIDSTLVDAFPRQTFQSFSAMPQCLICSNRRPDCITYNDPKVPESPAYWCNECYEGFHLDEQGGWLYEHDKVCLKALSDDSSPSHPN